MADSQSENSRRAALEKERERMMSDLRKKKEQISKESEVKVSSDKFVAQFDSVEDELKRGTIGLVNLEDFRQLRAQLEKKREQEAEPAGGTAQDKKKKRKTAKRADLHKLSFGDPEEEEEEQQDSRSTAPATKPGLWKNPDVNTSFLPDRKREEEERKERERLKAEWLAQQEVIKQELIDITYSYWDGRGHRNKVTCRKGDTIYQFLDAVRKQWPELRSVPVENLVYVKEDLLIPHHYTFYDFIINRVRGKSGPIFEFDVKDDVRLLHDASSETTESHAGKVCERSWYERNKHIFPASRWETFDPDKEYAVGGYRIKDTKKENKKDAT
ncbi:hypothetical protein RI367_007640 [Sorochytrium milnesiophthora]